MSTFVSLGQSKKPFHRLLHALGELAKRGVLPKPIIVQSGHTPFTSDTMEVIPFMTMAAYEHEISSANLVIMQAGGGGVLLALINQKIPILVPRKAILGEVIDDHQAANASNLSKLGHAIAVDDESEIEQAICLAMDMQNQKQNTREGNELSDAIARDLYKYSMHI